MTNKGSIPRDALTLQSFVWFHILRIVHQNCQVVSTTPPFFFLGTYSQNAILNIISAKIMCLLRFSIARI